MKKIIELMKHDIKGHNKFMTDEKLDKMSVNKLLNNVSPLYRKDFAQQLNINIRTDDNYNV